MIKHLQVSSYLTKINVHSLKILTLNLTSFLTYNEHIHTVLVCILTPTFYKSVNICGRVTGCPETMCPHTNVLRPLVPQIYRPLGHNVPGLIHPCHFDHIQ